MSNSSISSIVEYVKELVDLHDAAALYKHISSLHAADAAEIIEILPNNYRVQIVSILGHKFNPEILTYLDEAVRESIVDLWAEAELGSVLAKIEEQDAVEILSDLSQESRRSLLRSLKPELRVILEESLSYPDDSAGRLMNHEFLALPLTWTVEQAHKLILQAEEYVFHLSGIFLVNNQRSPVSFVPFAKLIKTAPTQPLSSIAEELVASAKLNDTEEEVCLIFRKYFLHTLPIVDNKNRLVGIVESQEILDLIHDKASETFLQSAGVTESDFYNTIITTLTSRLKWLAISCIHSFTSAYVILHFQKVLGENLLLTSLNQILLAICGTAGLQAVTVTVRALLGRDLVKYNTARAISKEFVLGVINGGVCALILGIALLLFLQGNPKALYITVIFSSSIFLSMVFANTAGSLIPILLAKVGIDPAISAGPLLSSMADTVGLLIIFNLAYYFL